jgi:hypothetical protein
MALFAEYTTFTLDEALNSSEQEVDPNAPPPPVRGHSTSWWSAAALLAPSFAQHLLGIDRTRSCRIRVLEGGPFVLPEPVQNFPLSATARFREAMDWTRASSTDGAKNLPRRKLTRVGR